MGDPMEPFNLVKQLCVSDDSPVWRGSYPSPGVSFSRHKSFQVSAHRDQFVTSVVWLTHGTVGRRSAPTTGQGFGVPKGAVGTDWEPAADVGTPNPALEVVV